MQSSHKILRNNCSGPINGGLTLKLRHRFQAAAENGTDQKDEREAGRQIIDEARKQAEKILARANKEAEEKARELKEKAIHEGREQGREQGYREGLKKAEAEATEIRNRALNILRQAEAERTKTLDSLEGEIVKLSVEIAEKIIYRQLSVDGDTIKAITAEALKLVKDRQNIIIFHHPADRDTLEQHRMEWQRLLPAQASIKFIADEAISPGGCIVETEQGKVEATIESRWQAILDSLGIGEQKKCQ